MDPLFLGYNSHNSDRFNNRFLVDVVAVMGDVFISLCNFHVLLGFKVGCSSSDVGCEVGVVFIFLC
jgi:hypothetical protein